MVDDHTVYSLHTGTATDIDPDEWQDHLYNSFLEFCSSEINDANAHKLAYAETVLEDPESISADEWRAQLEPRQSTAELLDEYDDIGDDELVDATLHDLIDVMQGLVPAKDDPAYSDRVGGFRQAVEQFDPNAYDVLDSDDTYRMTVLDDAQDLHENTVMAESCIGFDVSYDYLMDSEFGEVFEQQVSDEHTYILQVEKNGEPKGYSRNIVMEDGEGDRFLAIDTTEVDRTKYDPHTVQALGLAGIQLGLDLGLDYIGMAAADGRVKEVNDGYGNTQRTIEYEKVGGDLEMVSNFFPWHDSRSVDLLLENPDSL